MPPAHFSASRVRVAATCPRILYFDAEHARRTGLARPAVTRIWRAGGDPPAADALFHAAAERFKVIAEGAATGRGLAFGPKCHPA